MKQIIAIGGGGFVRSSADDQARHMGHYLIEQTGKKNPKVCFLSQASAESKEYMVWFYKTFLALGAQPSDISLFGSVKNNWKGHLLAQDVIYVGGGNTRSMLALWREWGMDALLREAYEKGIVLSGVSAGAICWFEQCITDSVWPLGALQGLGILKGSCCPHYDSEPERRPTYLDFTKQGIVLPGIALEDDTAAHFVDGVLKDIVVTKKDRKAFTVSAGVEEELKTVFIG
ncbi:MAG TPA: peptidase E [Candidatus Babeliales bacterium]|nr:peptidase E [Candidatus Babeliales bacterium]